MVVNVWDRSILEISQYCVAHYAWSTGRGRDNESTSPMVSELELEFRRKRRTKKIMTITSVCESESCTGKLLHTLPEPW
jgi:hypothetical protein